MSIDLKMLEVLQERGFHNKDPLIGGRAMPATAMPYVRVRRDPKDRGDIYADIIVLDWMRHDGRAKLSVQGFIGTADEPSTMTSLYRHSMAVMPATALIDQEMRRMLCDYEARVLDYGWGILHNPLQGLEGDPRANNNRNY